MNIRDGHDGGLDNFDDSRLEALYAVLSGEDVRFDRRTVAQVVCCIVKDLVEKCLLQVPMADRKIAASEIEDIFEERGVDSPSLTINSLLEHEDHDAKSIKDIVDEMMATLKEKVACNGGKVM